MDRRVRRCGSDGITSRCHGAVPVVLLVALLLGLAASAEAAPCEPWETEPTPLPRVDEADELRARWATFRVRELSTAALAREADDPGSAHRLWRRVLCLDPGSVAAAEGLVRTPLVAVHRPELVNRVAPGVPDDPIETLSYPLRVWRPVPVAPAEIVEDAPSGTTSALATLLGEAEDHLRAARFEETLERVAVGLGELGERSAPAETARLEVLGATAALALGHTSDAESALARALAADPELSLDPSSTPPKVRRALERVRAERAPE